MGCGTRYAVRLTHAGTRARCLTIRARPSEKRSIGICSQDEGAKKSQGVVTHALSWSRGRGRTNEAVIAHLGEIHVSAARATGVWCTAERSGVYGWAQRGDPSYLLSDVVNPLVLFSSERSRDAVLVSTNRPGLGSHRTPLQQQSPNRIIGLGDQACVLCIYPVMTQGRAAGAKQPCSGWPSNVAATWGGCGRLWETRLPVCQPHHI